MTEKRFKIIETITHDDKRIYELTKNDIGYYNFKGEKLLAHMICNELNKLSEENKELKYKYDEQSNEKMGLEEDIDRLLKDNKELKKELLIHRRIASCSNCKYQNYDWFDDGDEFEVCERGNNEQQIEYYICEEWREI